MRNWIFLSLLALAWLHLSVCAQSDGEREEKLRQGVRLLSVSVKASKVKESMLLFEEVARGGGRLAGDAYAHLAFIYTFKPSHFNPSKGFRSANQSASLESPRGMHLLAFYYSHGIYNVPKNPLRAKELNIRAAKRNYVQALMTLAFEDFIRMQEAEERADKDHFCLESLDKYHAAATAVVSFIRRNYREDFLSLHSPDGGDRLGDNTQARAAREKETLNYYLHQAELRDPDALYQLGRIYQLGLHGARRDVKSAVAYFERAVERGSVPAMAELGRLLTLGSGVDMDLSRSLNLLRSAADAKDASSMATLGVLLRKGLLTSSDPSMSEKYLQEAASLGNPEGEYELGEIDLLNGRSEEAAIRFHSAEKQNHIKSILALGSLYDKGIGVTKSCPKAVEYYKRVCEAAPWVGDEAREARRMFTEGQRETSFLLSLLAADEGFEVSQFNAAWLLLRHHVQRPPPSKYALALSLLKKSALLTHDKSSLLLIGDLYRRGEYRNLSMAAEYYMKASKQGSAVAMGKLAALHQNGAGVPSNDSLALDLLKKASLGIRHEVQGVQLAASMLGIGLRVLQIRSYIIVFFCVYCTITFVISTFMTAKYILTAKWHVWNAPKVDGATHESDGSNLENPLEVDVSS